MSLTCQAHHNQLYSYGPFLEILSPLRFWACLTSGSLPISLGIPAISFKAGLSYWQPVEHLQPCPVATPHIAPAATAASLQVSPPSSDCHFLPPSPHNCEGRKLKVSLGLEEGRRGQGHMEIRIMLGGGIAHVIQQCRWWGGGTRITSVR